MTVKDSNNGSDSKKESDETRSQIKESSERDRPHHSLTRMTGTARDKMDDDPFRSKPSWIPDLRSEQDWEMFLANKVRIP